MSELQEVAVKDIRVGDRVRLVLDCGGGDTTSYEGNVTRLGSNYVETKHLTLSPRNAAERLYLVERIVPKAGSRWRDRDLGSRYIYTTDARYLAYYWAGNEADAIPEGVILYPDLRRDWGIIKRLEPIGNDDDLPERTPVTSEDTCSCGRILDCCGNCPTHGKELNDE